MGEPLGLQDIFFSTMAGAAIVLMGASYALFFALGRLHQSRAMSAASLASYILLAAATYVLVDSLALSTRTGRVPPSLWNARQMFVGSGSSSIEVGGGLQTTRFGPTMLSRVIPIFSATRHEAAFSGWTIATNLSRPSSPNT